MSSWQPGSSITYASYNAIPYSSRQQPSHHVSGTPDFNVHPFDSYAICPDLSPLYVAGMFRAQPRPHDAEASWPLDAEPEVSHCMMRML
jgi:hypothetical protein